MGRKVERSLRVEPGAGGRADAVVRGLTGLPHSVVRGLFDHGCVRVDEAPCEDGARLLGAGERLSLAYEEGRRYRPKARPRTNRAFRLVYEDAQLLVVDKQAGVLTVPNHGELDTLVGALANYLGRGARRRHPVQVVHRLDRDTSGLLVFAKRPAVAEQLKAQFEAHKPEREYLALVAGVLVEEQGTFRSQLATDLALNQYSVREGEGKPAVTHFRVLRRLQGATLVSVRLETGRRNQIRVHFAEAGHPVLGDTRYRPDLAAHPLWKARRLALHAAVLGFTHPVSGEPLRFEAPPPPALTRFLERGADGARKRGGRPGPRGSARGR